MVLLGELLLLAVYREGEKEKEGMCAAVFILACEITLWAASPQE